MTKPTMKSGSRVGRKTDATTTSTHEDGSIGRGEILTSRTHPSPVLSRSADITGARTCRPMHQNTGIGHITHVSSRVVQRPKQSVSAQMNECATS